MPPYGYLGGSTPSIAIHPGESAYVIGYAPLAVGGATETFEAIAAGAGPALYTSIPVALKERQQPSTGRIAAVQYRFAGFVPTVFSMDLQGSIDNPLAVTGQQVAGANFQRILTTTQIPAGVGDGITIQTGQPGSASQLGAYLFLRLVIQNMTAGNGAVTMIGKIIYV